MNNGWIKLHRKFIEWEWYDDINTKILFLHCLLKANHEDKKYRGEVVPRGSFLTGLDVLSKQTGLSVQKIRTSISKLKSTNELTHRATRKGSHIFLTNYDLYQTVEKINTQSNIKITNEQQTSNKQATSNKNDKNYKNDKNICNTGKNIPPSLEEIKLYISEKKYNIDPDRFYHFYNCKDWFVGKNKMKNWHSAIANWSKNDRNNNDTRLQGICRDDAIKSRKQRLIEGAAGD